MEGQIVKLPVSFSKNGKDVNFIMEMPRRVYDAMPCMETMTKPPSDSEPRDFFIKAHEMPGSIIGFKKCQASEFDLDVEFTSCYLGQPLFVRTSSGQRGFLYSTKTCRNLRIEVVNDCKMRFSERGGAGPHAALDYGVMYVGTKQFLSDSDALLRLFPCGFGSGAVIYNTLHDLKASVILLNIVASEVAKKEGTEPVLLVFEDELQKIIELKNLQVMRPCNGSTPLCFDFGKNEHLARDHAVPLPEGPIRLLMQRFSMQKKCAVCRAPTFMTCGRCNAVHYCNSECQKKDWRNHKSACAPK